MKVKGMRLLRHAGMLLVLGSTLAAGIAPDWSRVLKAQGYYGSQVDLSLSLTPSLELAAGGDADFLLRAGNVGPDNAHRARTIAGFSGPIAFGATSGCVSDPAGFPQCVFAAPLDAGGITDYLLHATVAPDARGEVELAVAVTSDDEEINPGDEVEIYRAQIVARLDLQTSIACESRARVGQPLVCWFTFHNQGPAAALSPTLNAIAWAGSPLEWSCQATRVEQCPPPGNGASYLGLPAVLGPAEEVRFRVQATPTSGLETMDFTAVGYAFGETELNWTNDEAAASVPVSLFFDGFDGN